MRSIPKELKHFVRVIIRSLNLFKHSLLQDPKINVKKLREDSRYSVFIESYRRQDLQNHSHAIKSVIGSHVAFCFSDTERNFSLNRFFKSFKVTWQLRRKVLDFVLAEKLQFPILAYVEFFSILFVAFSRIQRCVTFLEKADSLVSFQEMVPEENLLCQLANLMNIPTVAMIHGLGYVDMRGTDVSDSYALVHYKPTVAKNIFCWGNFHKDVFKRYTEARCYLVGKPTNEAIVPEEIKPGVLFIYDSDKETNNVLTFLSEGLVSRGVPTSCWYKSDTYLALKRGNRSGPCREIVVGSKSTLLLDLALSGLRVFVVKSSPLVHFFSSDYVVRDVTDLVKAYTNNCAYVVDPWHHLIQFTGSDSLNAISIAFKECLRN